MQKVFPPSKWETESKNVQKSTYAVIDENLHCANGPGHWYE